MPLPSRDRYDVVVLGGAIAGASTALLLRRENPSLSVLVVEKGRAFDLKVGEATTEMSGMFLTRRLGLWGHLEMEHLPKEGLRYWFANESVRAHSDATEAGGFVRSTVPSFQLKRDVLDQHVLDLAVAAGAELVRPARAGEITVGSFDHRVTIEDESGTATVGCRWLIDATGRACLLGRRLGLIERNERHPTAAMWCRWSGVAHIDDLAARAGGGLAARNVSSRRLATNHYVGRGYWVWFIPLGSGETSIGIVWDRRLVGLHERTDREAAYVDFLRALVPAAELLDDATMRAQDFRYYSTLAYATRQYMGEGWALVGDAAAFLDPYYSPGLDHVGFSVEATTRIVLDDARGELAPARIEEHNRTFLRSYWRFFDAIFEGKYLYMGEADLLSAAMLMDTAQYYIFVVTPAYRYLGRYHWMPVLGPKEAFFAYHLLRLYHRRFQRLADLRLEMGEAGKRNSGRRIRAFFDLGIAPWRMGLRGARLWLLAELDGVRLRARKLLGLRARARPGAAAAGAGEPAAPPSGS
ncbi:MAG: NAD(P)/FAD-dependent oxidoreductase [Thermoanaerobaculia bacterium]|nr:MAG: NAD(P)/FAD-dependent oxidoreductase [Thermoanaerobaculia bacterium]